MNRFLSRAIELKEETVSYRRKVHQFGGLGFEIKETSDFVFETLLSYGLIPERICGTGIVCTLGAGEKTILLRADMDALPIVEQTGLPFSCQNGTMHACGHDLHTAILLTVARLLFEREDELPGRVKLMFQPAEEALCGCEAMVKAGVLENPKVDAALAFHVLAGEEEVPTGGIRYVRGVTSGACNTVRITVSGQDGGQSGCGRPADPVSTAARVLLGIQELVSMELPSNENAVITFGSVHAQTDPGGLPGKAELSGTIRTLSKEARTLLLGRVREIAEGTAEAFGARAKVEYPLSCGLCICDLEMLDTLLPVWAGLVGEENLIAGKPKAGSEDFGYIMERVPSVQVSLGAGRPSEGFSARNHLPDSNFDESVLPVGAALYAQSALSWLEQQRDQKGGTKDEQVSKARQ